MTPKTLFVNCSHNGLVLCAICLINSICQTVKKQKKIQKNYKTVKSCEINGNVTRLGICVNYLASFYIDYSHVYIFFTCH